LLSAAAIDHLTENRNSFDFKKPVGITYYYFKFEDRTKCQEEIVRTLLKNLASQITPLPFRLVQLYDEQKRFHLPPQYSILVDVLTSCVDQLSCFVFLDALDEGSDEQQREVLGLVSRLIEFGMRVFLTSQPHLIPLVNQIAELSRCPIRANVDDLTAYIEQRMKIQCPLLQPDLKLTILRNLLDGADEMYHHLFCDFK